MGTQVEVKVVVRDNRVVNNRARQHVLRPQPVPLVYGQEARVMSRTQKRERKKF